MVYNITAFALKEMEQNYIKTVLKIIEKINFPSFPIKKEATHFLCSSGAFTIAILRDHPCPICVLTS